MRLSRSDVHRNKTPRLFYLLFDPKRVRFLFCIVTLLCLLFIQQTIFRPTDHSPKLVNLSDRNNSSSTRYEQIVLLSCSSDSYSLIYCYYLPFVALAWRRLGFEPIVFLVGSKEHFQSLPLMNFLENELKIEFYFIAADKSRSIATSQLVRLFGGFLSYEQRTTKDLFIFIADVDLLPLTRHRFDLVNNENNSIVIVNAFCCPGEKFSHELFRNIPYYPISYVGMTQRLWQRIFFPLNRCQLTLNLSIDLIQCCLEDKMNRTIPKNVIKASDDWDIDQKLLSILIARAQRLLDVSLDKRRLGDRLDPDPHLLSSQWRSILSYDDIHLPNQHEEFIFNNHTWSIFSAAFRSLFSNDIIEHLSHYHQKTTEIFEQKRKFIDVLKKE